MADNVAITAGTGTTIAADDIGAGVLAQRVKPVWGPDGTGNDIDVATGKPLPVQVRSATGLIPIGEPTDAKSTATDTTSASGISIWKQISASVQSAVTALGSTALDLGISTGGTRTLRVAIDTASQNANGTATSANSTPVVIASDQAWPVSTIGFMKKEDVASADGDAGIPALAVRKATPADTSGTDGDYEFLQIKSGRLWGSTQAYGDIAHDSADASPPQKGGHKATTSLAGLTLVSSADVTDSFAGVDGVQIVRPHCNLEDIVSGLLANTDGASTSVIAAQGAGVKTYITTVIMANSSATAVTVDLRDGAAGSVKATFPVPANTSGVVCNLPVPLGFTANTAVCMDGSTGVSTVTCTLIGFKSKI